jgi:ATP-binding cassette, subfamily C (CFTR/MRP), member 1
MGLWYLYGCKTVCILQGTSSFAKQPKVLAFAILAIKILNLVLWAHTPVVQSSVAAASMAFAGAIILTVLVLFEHNRSKRPSSIISVYLLALTVADSWVLRTLKLRYYAPVVVRISWTSIFMQLAWLALESTSRRAQLRNPGGYGLEETTGIFDCSAIWWLNRLFWKGNRSVLSQSDLFPLDSELKSQRLRDRVVLAWDESMIPGFCL